jgi:hypothetical protein
MTDTLIEIGRGVFADKPRRLFKTMLLFPPEWVPTAPYLALPSLTAVLRSYGHQVVQKDVNIEMYDWFFSDTFLIWVKLRMDQQRRGLDEREARNELTDLERDRLACLTSQDGVDVMELAEQVAEAKAIVRGEAFYDAEKLEWALNTFRDVMQFISAAYFPASLVFYPMESNLGYRSGVSKEVLACLEDETVNVYRDVCRQLVLPAIQKERPEVVGISVGTQMQLLAGMTFCKMIKQEFPDIHVTVGGNVITRLQEDLPKQKQFFTQVFDSAILYEGEHALVWLLEALAGERDWEKVPNLMWYQDGQVRVNAEIYTERPTALPLPDFRWMPILCRFEFCLTWPHEGVIGDGVLFVITGRDISINIAGNPHMMLFARSKR